MAGDLTLTAANLPPEGVVFAEGALRFDASDTSGNWTLVSGRGEVVIVGADNTIEPYLGNVIAISFGRGVSVEGPRNALTGELFAPRGTLQVEGDHNVLAGLFFGLAVRVSGSENVLSDGTHPIPTP